MWGKLVINSFRRDPRKKAVAISAVALATCLATFLLNWSLNLGDKIQRDLRAYGANIMITPQGESLALVSGAIDLKTVGSERYLSSRELTRLRDIFWTNQIVAYAPVLLEGVRFGDSEVMIVGTEFGRKEITANFPRAAPYLQVEGKWPVSENEAAAGALLAQKHGWGIGDEIRLQREDRDRNFRITGLIRSGGVEEKQLFATLKTVQEFTGHPDAFKQLLVSAVVTPQNKLYLKHQRNPRSLTPRELERYSCTPYITSVATDIQKVFTGGEARIIRQVSQTEEKVATKVNRLMILVTLAALIAASLTMTSTTTGIILERRRELALMKAIGSNNIFISLYLFTEILVLGILGSLLGYFLGTILSVALSQSVFQSVLEIKLIVLPMVFLVGLLIILCGSLWPLRHAVTLDPASVLKDL